MANMKRYLLAYYRFWFYFTPPVRGVVGGM